MQPQTPMMAQGSTALALAQNRVLRNTYWLLALSLVPTVAGAWIGIATAKTVRRLPHSSGVTPFAWSRSVAATHAIARAAPS